MRTLLSFHVVANLARLVGLAGLVGLVGCVVGDDETTELIPIVNPTDADDRVHVQVGAVHTRTGLCSGTVIGRRVVVTAAHCFASGPATSFTSDKFTTPAMATVTHRAYTTGVEEDDIALVLLRDPVPFAVAPIDANPVATERRVLAVGYGLTGGGRTDSGVRRSGTVRVSRVGNLSPNAAINDMIMTVADPSNICYGDSGGGLFDGARLVGVTSGVQTVDGVECAGRAFFARIDRHYGFIRDQAAAWGESLGAEPPPGCGLIDVDAYMDPGEMRSSCNGRYLLAHQHDGNLVLYRTDNGLRALWASNTAGRTSQVLVMQGDGNLVLYSPDRALWHAGTHNHPGSVAYVQDDGNLVIYAPGSKALWSTNTAGR